MRAALLLIIASVAFAAAPKAPPASDAVVEAAIRAKFAKSKISEDQFRVSVKSGIATLEGKTDVPQRKGVATRLAKSGGAREVVNKIQVSEAARKKLSDRLQKARESKSKPASKTVQNTPAVKAPITAVAVVPQPPAATPAQPRRMEIKH